MVLHDVRMARPLGRWVELARLALIRKEYAFLYSKLLKVRHAIYYVYSYHVQFTTTNLFYSDLPRVETWYST